MPYIPRMWDQQFELYKGGQTYSKKQGDRPNNKLSD